MGIKVIATNRKAFHDYSVGERFEAGIQLRGTEVKALRDGRVNLTDGWVDIENDEAYLRDAHIGHYSHGNQMNHPEKRPRKLLLHKKEIAKLSQAASAKGMTILPLKIYFKGQYVKVEIGLGKGKKAHDKRDTERRKSADREIARALRR